MKLKDIKLKYLRNKGERCYACGSKKITIAVDDVEFDTAKAYVQNACRDCHATWLEKYVLSYIEPQNIGSTPSEQVGMWNE